MKRRIIAYFKKILGITDLEETVSFLNENYAKIVERQLKQEKLLESVMEDNRTIIEQYKLIIKDFSVAADISYSRHEPSVVLIMRKMHGHKEDIIKTYSFDRETLQEVNHFLSRFPEQNTTIDGPRGMPRPKHRFR